MKHPQFGCTLWNQIEGDVFLPADIWNFFLFVIWNSFNRWFFVPWPLLLLRCLQLLVQVFYKIPLGICLSCIRNRIHLSSYGKCLKIRKWRITGPCSVVLLTELTLENNVFLIPILLLEGQKDLCRLLKAAVGLKVNSRFEELSPYFLDCYVASWKEGVSFCFCKADRYTMKLIGLGNSKEAEQKKRRPIYLHVLNV